ncbi:DUF1403 family protein [Bradyrhizobium sp. 142]|uniref:DUF1403 family protein n=1 Tax=Bradyrhizobium sp. 142 TaxID=2782618 RepID=UPI001FFBB81D|nr:DUF1403 family protein [Bradyrhizobium sp. 142]
MPEPPPTFPPVPGWTRQVASTQPIGDAMFFAGSALAAVHPIARCEHPLGGLWRQRLALASAALLARHGGRSEDEAALRDAWYLRREGDDPGPGGRILKAWRHLGQHAAMMSKDSVPQDRMLVLSTLLELRFNDALDDVVTAAANLAAGQGSAVAAAAEIAATSLRSVPESEPLALWLADVVLAHRLKWPMAVPLIASQVRRADLRAASKADASDQAWPTACALAYARAAAAASDLYVGLVGRANRLLATAPKLRGRDADRMVLILLTEDAQPAGAGKTASDRSTRRLFERLVALGAVRELTGRSSFRLYGL